MNKPLTLILSLTLLAALLGGVATTPPARAAGTWSTTDSMNAVRRYHTATLLPDGRVLVAGGHYNDGNPYYLASAETYTPARGIWSGTGSLHTARAQHTATLLTNGKVLVVGGYDGDDDLASAELYDLVAGTWSNTGSLATGRSDHTATLLSNGKVLVVGGQGSSDYLTSAELYDPATGVWSAASAMADRRESHTATLLPDGKVLVVGGFYVDSDYHYLTSAEVYSPGTNTWSSAGTLAAARANHTATLLTSGKVLVAGGRNSGSNALQSVEVYDPAAGWSTTGPLAAGRGWHTATLLPNGRVLVAGGGFLASAEVYNPIPGTWSATGSLVTAHTYHTATLLPDGRVLAVGGVGGSGDLANAEIYQPAAGAWSNVDSLNTARRDHAAALLHNGQVLVSGGYDGSTYLASAENYKQSTDTWLLTGSMNDARARHTMTLLPTGRLMVVGGYNGSYLASAEILNPTTGTWSATGSLGVARADHTATLLADGRLLVAGGANAGGKTSSAEIYDPAAGTWKKTGTLHAVRSGHTATLLYDGRVLVAGGYSSGAAPVATAEVYDPATETWSVTGSLGDARVWHTATFLYDGRVLVVGGLGWTGSDFTYLASAELYNPGTGAWSATGSLNSARDHHAAVLLPNSQVLVAGGFFWDGADHWLAGTEIYDPGTGTWELVSGLHNPRAFYTLTLLPDGRLLAAGGYDSSFMASAEVYDQGLGFSESWRPTLITATSPLYQGQRLQISGSGGYRGFLYTEAASGGTQSSPTNYPLVQLRRLDNERILWLHPDLASSFSATSFTSEPVSGFPQGPALVTVFVNGIPSTSKVIQVLGYRLYLPLTLKNY